MQGPFSKELNLAMLRSIGAAWMVTKEAGRAGGFEEKMTAAKEAGVKVVLIGRPQEQAGLSIEEGVKLLAERFHIPSDLTDSRDEKNGRIAYLVGIGMGTPDHLTCLLYTSTTGQRCGVTRKTKNYLPV